MTDLERWIGEVCGELGIDPAVVTRTSPAVLDLVRDVAHGVSRPAAPLTAFIVGLAAGADHAPGEALEVEHVQRWLDQAVLLVGQWPPSEG